LSSTEAKIEVNEWIERWSDIKHYLDLLVDTTIERVSVVNDGCDEWLVRKIVGYLENHGITVSFN